MERALIGRQREEEALDARKFPIMRTLARLHECDIETLYGMVDAEDGDVREVLKEMVSKREVEASYGRQDEKFALTPEGWAEYIKALGSLYELPE